MPIILESKEPEEWNFERLNKHLGNKEWGQIGTNYIKGLFALGLQGLFLMVCLGIYAVLVKTIQITDIHTGTFTILGYAILLGLMMLKSGTLAKSVLNAH